jgi:hypothetical protein
LCLAALLSMASRCTFTISTISTFRTRSLQSASSIEPNIMLRQPCRMEQSASAIPEPVVFVKNQNHPAGLSYVGRVPGYIDRRPPTIKPPLFPDARVTSLNAMSPCILFVQFGCAEGCRSFGICVHYQFVLGCKRCPDGLVCDVCRGGQEQAVAAERFCPLHQDVMKAKPISSRPEDFLASSAQRQVAADVLRRSLNNTWEVTVEEQATHRVRKEELAEHEMRSRATEKSPLIPVSLDAESKASGCVDPILIPFHTSDDWLPLQ